MPLRYERAAKIVLTMLVVQVTTATIISTVMQAPFNPVFRLEAGRVRETTAWSRGFDWVQYSTVCLCGKVGVSAAAVGAVWLRLHPATGTRNEELGLGLSLLAPKF